MTTFWRLNYHIIWATKNRLPLITSLIEPDLHQFLWQKAAEFECKVDAVNGMENHVHMVLSIPPKYAISEIVQRLKGTSSHDFPDLFWQRCYGVFSLGAAQRKTVVAYVMKQKEHHKLAITNTLLEQVGEERNE